MKRKLILTNLAIFLMIGSLYFYYFSKPTEFLSENIIIEEIDGFYSGAGSDIEIQDIIFIDDTHVFVPFVSNGQYGSSYWFWEKRSWNLGNINTMQNPYLWKIDPKDPASFVLVWNIDPSHDISEFAFYLLNQRNFIVSYQVHQYTPKVQLDITTPIDKLSGSYGVLSLPSDWISFLDAYLKVEQSKQRDTMFFDFFQPNSVYFGWIPYNVNGEKSFPESANGSGYGFGKIHLEHLMILDEYDLE